MILEQYADNIVFDWDATKGSIKDQSSLEIATTTVGSPLWGKTDVGYGVDFQEAGYFSVASNATLNANIVQKDWSVAVIFDNLTKNSYEVLYGGGSGTGYGFLMELTLSGFFLLEYKDPVLGGINYKINGYVKQGLNVVVVSYDHSSTTLTAKVNGVDYPQIVSGATLSVSTLAGRTIGARHQYISNGTNSTISRIIEFDGAFTSEEQTQLTNELKRMPKNYKEPKRFFGNLVNRTEDLICLNGTLDSNGNIMNVGTCGSTVSTGLVPLESGLLKREMRVLADSKSNVVLPLNVATELTNFSVYVYIKVGENTTPGATSVLSPGLGRSGIYLSNYTPYARCFVTSDNNVLGDSLEGAGYALVIATYDYDNTETKLYVDNELKGTESLYPLVLTHPYTYLGENPGTASSQSVTEFKCPLAGVVDHVFTEDERTELFEQLTAMTFRDATEDLPVNLGVQEYTFDELVTYSGTVDCEEDSVGKHLECTSTFSGAVPHDKAVGSWYWKFYHKDGVTDTLLFINDKPEYSNNNGYFIAVNSNERIDLRRVAAGSSGAIFLTSDDYINGDSEVELFVTRDNDFEFTGYIRGGGVFSEWTQIAVVSGSNPATNTTYKTSNFMTLQLGVGSKHRAFKYWNGVIDPTVSDPIN